MVKIISLSVHKNTLEQRRRHQCRKRMLGAVKSLNMDVQNVGFCIVTWDKDGRWRADISDPDGVVGTNNIPVYAAASLSRQIASYDKKK